MPTTLLPGARDVPPAKAAQSFRLHLFARYTTYLHYLLLYQRLLLEKRRTSAEGGPLGSHSTPMTADSIEPIIIRQPM